MLELTASAFSIGGCSGVVSPSTLGDILRSQFGTFWLLQMVLLVPAMLLRDAGGFRVAATGERTDQDGGGGTTPVMAVYLALGAAYLGTIALTGHAAAVQQLIASSVTLDWMHLAATSVWVGGMWTIALALTFSLTRRSDDDAAAWLGDRAALLSLLDAYSPAAFIAVPIAAMTGIFNAQVHLGSFEQLYQTSYGRFLLVKLVLIAEMILISASHVFGTRPRLRRMLAAGDTGPIFREAMDSLIVRLQLEPLLGAGVLLCVAIMGQVAPSVTIFSAPSQAATISSPAKSPAPAALAPAPAILGTARAGVLEVALTIDPAAVGRSHFFAVVRQRASVVTNGQVRVRLSVPGQSALGSVFVETTPQQGGYAGAGDLVQEGLWQAEVFVRTRDDPEEFRAVPFKFLVGPGASFIGTGTKAGAASISIVPGTLTEANTLTLTALPAAAVRVLSQSLERNVGVITLPAGAAGKDRWSVHNAWAPMSGRWSLTVQLRESASGPWLTLRSWVYDVPASGAEMHLLPNES